MITGKFYHVKVDMNRSITNIMFLMIYNKYFENYIAINIQSIFG